jgi:hypothetical protein
MRNQTIFLSLLAGVLCATALAADIPAPDALTEPIPPLLSGHYIYTPGHPEYLVKNVSNAASFIFEAQKYNQEMKARGALSDAQKDRVKKNAQYFTAERKFLLDELPKLQDLATKSADVDTVIGNTSLGELQKLVP